MHGNTVQLDPGVSPAPQAAARAVDNAGVRLVVQSVGLNVPLGAINEVDGQIVPPGFSSAYWVRNMGVSIQERASGTVYVVMHSLRNGGVGPGNYLADVAHGRSRLANGATVALDGIEYAVTGSQLIDKAQIAANTVVWANTPDRLILITCLEHANGTPSTQNLVITATLRTPVGG
ncbi:class F sortase [Leifsonia shinshuensis]|uniref:class F sortase n=1 Tax=Leifsonia shinshuensis TaxID=150026 RepID=UPI001F506E8D|nr:class F sortase [Leifsonia shinshuensis]MCI0158355.1 class F sortase [Leifsonia shinshuensis]